VNNSVRKVSVTLLFYLKLAMNCSVAVFVLYALSGFLNENVRYPVWTCRDPISLILGIR